MLRKVLALVGLAVAFIGVGLFVAIGVQAWYVKAEVLRQTDYLSSQANIAGDAAEHAIEFVRQVIDQAEGDLTHARTELMRQPATPVNPLLQLTARQASLKLVGSVQRAQGAVVAASDAVVVADAALDVVNKLASENPELKTLFGVSPDHVQATKTVLGSVAEELRQARTVLGVPLDGGVLSLEQLGEVDAALVQARWFTDEMVKVVTTARGRVNAMRTKVDLWTSRAAVGVTALCLLGIVGQFFLGRFCVRKLRNLPA